MLPEFRLSEVKDVPSFLKYLDQTGSVDEKNADQLIQVIAKQVLSDQFVVYGYANVRQYLESQIVVSESYVDCPEGRVPKLQALLDKVPEKELDFSPTQEVFLRSNESAVKVDNLTKKQAIDYACEVGEDLETFHLDLYSGKVTLEDLARLVEACPNILHLDLGYLKLEGYPDSREATDTILNLPKLESLRVNSYLLSDEFFGKLADCKNLKALDISCCSFGDRSIEILTKLQNVESLILEGKRGGYGGFCSALTDRVLVHLRSFPNLKRVNLKGQSITSTAVEEFKREYPTVEVTIDKVTKPVRRIGKGRYFEIYGIILE